MPAFREIVERLGGHPIGALGIDAGDDAGLLRWLVAACLLAARGPESAALEAWRSLDRAALLEPGALAAADVETLAARLAEAGVRQPERSAALLRRLGRRLRPAGASLRALLDGADDLESAGAALVGLAPGLGPATALRFLRPLRARVAAAREAPLAEAARTAARDLGWIAGDEDEDGAPGALAAALERDPGAPDLADVEAALERLGRAACVRRRPERCPLGADCPRRGA